jgi:hypothetical protein
MMPPKTIDIAFIQDRSTDLGNAVIVTHNGLAVDDAGARPQASQRLDDQWEAAGEVLAGTAIEPHAVAILARDDAETIVLDLVDPGIAARRLPRFDGQAGRDEAARQGHGR